MTPQENKNLQKVQLSAGRDLRMRYIPRARIRPIYLQAAPWLDLLFILFFLVLAQSRLVMRPGVVVTLPIGASGGIQGGGTAVLIPEMRNGRVAASLFFGDEAFYLDSQERLEVLRGALTTSREVDNVATLTLYADQRVPQNYVMLIIDLASKAGFDHVNIGTAPHGSIH